MEGLPEEVGSELHFEEGEIYGFSGKEAVSRQEAVALEYTIQDKSSLQEKGDRQMKSARMEGLCVKSVLQCKIGGAHRVVVQITSNTQGLKGGIREFGLKTRASSSEHCGHSLMLTSPKNKIIECAS